MKTLCHLGDIQYFTKTRKKAKTESLRGLRPRKKVSYVKLDIDQRTQKSHFEMHCQLFGIGSQSLK